MKLGCPPVDVRLGCEVLSYSQFITNKLSVNDNLMENYIAKQEYSFAIAIL
jgi:hypothetical protein